MSRRTLIAAAAGLAVLGAAVAPWTLSGGLSASVADHLNDRYGLAFHTEGRSTFALLPVPRVKFEQIALASADGSVKVEGGTFRGELKLLPLLVGRTVLSTASLDGSRVTLGVPFDRLRLTDKVQAQVKAAAQGARIGELKLLDVSVRIPGATPLDNVNVEVDWPDVSGPLEVAGAFSWRGEKVLIPRVSLAPAALAAGQPSPVVALLEAPAGKLSLEGRLRLGEDPNLTGKAVVEATSVRALSRWTGLEFPLAFVENAASIAGEVSADRRRISWPAASVRLGPDELEGSVAIRLVGERPLVSATVAADRLNLTDLAAPLFQVRTAAGLWSGDDVSTTTAPVADLDLRLSANAAQLGRMKLSDVAANLLVRPGRIEASVARATLNGGTAKGRLALAWVEGSLELKTQGSFERVDLGGLLADTRQGRWLTGIAQGQFQLEGLGLTPADIVRQSHGRVTFAVKQGELVGIGLNDALRRVEKRPLAASLEWKGGRTPFDLLALNVNIGAGQGEIVEGSLTSATLRTLLQGRVSLVDRAVAIKAQVDAISAPLQAAAQPRPAAMIVFDLTGGWEDVAIIPDARSLIERSGAAKPLFGIERAAPAASAAAD
jgi:AsmA protein